MINKGLFAPTRNECPAMRIRQFVSNQPPGEQWQSGVARAACQEWANSDS